jgi:hypothetical protein
VVTYLLPGTQVIGALIVFRFVYFLVPLAIGSILFAATELAFRRKASVGGRRATKQSTELEAIRG